MNPNLRRPSLAFAQVHKSATAATGPELVPSLSRPTTRHMKMNELFSKGCQMGNRMTSEVLPFAKYK